MLREFSSLNDVVNYINASALVYLQHNIIVKNMNTLLPPGSEYQEGKFFKYKESTGVMSSISGSVDSIEKIIRKKFDHINCLVLESKPKKETIIAFRGTDTTDIKDLMSDFSLAKDAFFPLSEEIKEYVAQKIKISRNRGYKVIFTGHSLGGYIASKMTLEFKKTAVVFDAPGLENLLISHKGADIHCFVYSPNFVNCLGVHLGNLYHIPIITGLTNYFGIYNELMAVAVKEGIGSTFFKDFQGLLVNNVVKPLTAKTISYATGISANHVQHYLDLTIDFVSKIKEPVLAVKKDFDEKDQKYDLRKKFKHTTETHQLDILINGIYKNLKAKVKKIDTNHWPSAQIFSQSKLDNSLLKIVYLEDKKMESSSPHTQSISIASLSSTPTPTPTQSEPISTSDTRSQNGEDKAKNYDYSFLHSRIKTYLAILFIVGLFCKLSNDFNIPGIGKSFILVVLLFESMLKAGVKFDNTPLAGLFSSGLFLNNSKGRQDPDITASPSTATELGR